MNPIIKEITARGDKDGAYHQKNCGKARHGAVRDKDRNIIIELVEEYVAGHQDACEDAVECGPAEEVQGFCEVAEQEPKGD